MSHRILVVRSGALGDFILTLPVLEALLSVSAEARIDVIGRPEIVSLGINNCLIEDIISIDRADLAPFFIKNGCLSDTLSRRLAGYDHILSFLPDRDGVFRANVASVTNAPLTIVPAKPDESSRIHATIQFLQAIEPLGITHAYRLPCVRPSAEDIEAAALFLRDHKLDTSRDRMIAVHPGSGGGWKCWPADGFKQLIERLTQKGYAPVLISGPADESIVEDVMNGLGVEMPVAINRRSLTVLSALLGMCACMIGNDSGVTHLAAATGTPVVALFGPTDPAVWGPRGRHVRIIWGENVYHEDAARIVWGERPSVNPSLASISVETVLREIEEIIARPLRLS